MVNKKTRTTLFPLFLFFTTTLLIFSTIAPQGSFSQDPLLLTSKNSSTHITINTTTQNISPNTAFSATITIDPSQNIAGVQCDIYYNPALITVINITPGNLFNGYDTYFLPGTQDHINGTLTGIAGVITTPNGYVTQTGVFATLHLKTSSLNTGLSPLDLSNVIIGGPTADTVPVTITNTNITITENTETTQVGITPRIQTLPFEETHTFSIEVSPTTDIAGVQASLNYDPSSIQILNITQGTLFGTNTYFHTSDSNTLDGTIDSISSVITTPGGTMQSGTLAQITFKSLQKEGSTAITLANVIIGDPDGNTLPHTLKQGTITIGAIDSTKVSIIPSHQEIMQGNTVTVDIHIQPQTHVSGVQFDLAYDPSLLTFQEVIQGNFFQVSESYFHNGTLDTTQGVLHGVAGSVLGTTSGTINPGIFATVTFTAQSTLGQSPINLINVLLGDSDAQPLSYTLVNGSIDIIPKQTTISIIPQEKIIQPGDTFTLNIQVNPLEEISGVETDITFNSSLLTAISVQEGDLFTGFNTHFNNGTIHNNNGTIQGIWGVIATIGGGSTTTPGTFAQITFTAKTTPGSTPITISHALIGTPSATPVQTHIRHGTVTIGSQLTYTLTTGWNTLAFPFIDIGTAETLGNLIGVSDAIATWDPASQEYMIHPVGIPGQDFPIKPGHGYLIHVYEDTQFSVTGTISDNLTIPITMGWNLVGWIHDTDITAEEFGATIPGCDVVAKWNPSSQDYTIHPQTTPIQDFIIHPGDALFIHTNQDSTWHGT